MSGADIGGWIKSAAELWERGSLLLIALAVAAILGLGLFSILALTVPGLGTLEYIPWLGLAVLLLAVLAIFKVYQERNTKTLHFILDDSQCFWLHAPQADGRKLTQIALRGRVTNVSKQPIYPAAVVLLSPRSTQTIHKLIDTEEVGGGYYGNDYVIPPGERTRFSVHFFTDGFVGTEGKPMTIAISISDQFGHWHKVKIPNVWRLEDRTK